MKKIAFNITAGILCLSAAAYPQKLPSVQTNSIYAPTGIKTDGKTTEWDNKFQAYNTHIECFYTVSNDADNLYLIVQATNTAILRRIINGGITLLVSKTDKKNDKDGLAVTYPLFESNNRFTPQFRTKPLARLGAPVAVSNIGGGGNTSGISMSGVLVARSGSSMPDLTPAQADSLMQVNNTSFGNKAKTIGLKGFKDLDSTISVYNEEGFKAAGAFDQKFVFTCEMAVPLKYFGLNADSKFAYHVTINEVEQKGVNISTNPSGMKVLSVSTGAQMGQPATDFWGEYTLAKKP